MKIRTLFTRAAQAALMFGVALSATGSSTVLCLPPQAAVAGWWPGDNAVTDLANANGGTLVGDATYAAAVVGQGFSLDGDGDAVLIGNPPELQVQDFTIDLWVQRAAVPQSDSPALVAYGTNGYGLGLFGNTGELFLTKVQVDNIPSGLFITDTGFHHVALTKAGNQVYFYLDGVAAGPYTYNSVFSFTTPLAIGNRGDDFTAGFSGVIDEPQIFDRALSPAEIQAIFFRGANGQCKNQVCATSPPGQVAWFIGDFGGFDVQGGNYAFSYGDASIVTGKSGPGYGFDGDGDYLEADDAPPLNPVGQISLDAWVYPTSDTVPVDVSVVVNKEDPGSINTSYEFGRRNAAACGAGGGIAQGNLAFYLAVTGLPNNCNGWVDGGANLPLNTWSHVALTHDGGTIRAYVNGALTRTITGVGPMTAPSTGSLRIGGRQDTVSWFAGVIDELVIHNRALTAQEIRRIYRADSEARCLDCAQPAALGLVAWLEGEGDFFDSSGLVNDGAPTGGVGFMPGISGDAFSFGPGDDSVSLGQLSAIDGSPGLTVLAWVLKPNNDKSVAGIVGQWNGAIGSLNNAFLLYNSEGSFSNRGGFGVEFDDGTFASAAGTTQIPFNQWTLVAGTWRNSDGQVVLYKNGVAEGFSSGGVGRTINRGGVPPVQIGEWGYLRGGPYSWEGGIDEVMIFNRALTAFEIEDIYRAGARGVCFPTGCTSLTGFIGPDFTGTEASGKITTGLYRVGDLSSSAKVHLGTGDSLPVSAVAGVDYAAVPDRLITFPAGRETVQVTLPGIVADGLDENAETFELMLFDPSDAMCLDFTALSTARIKDSNPAPALVLDSVDSAVTEGSDITLSAHLSAVRGAPTVVNFTFSGTASGKKDLAFDLDGGGLPIKAINIPAGSLGGSITIHVLNDSLNEGDESFTAQVDSSSSYTLPVPPTVTWTLKDGNPLPDVSFAADTSSLTVEGNTKTLPVSLSSVSSQDVMVSYSFSGTSNTFDYIDGGIGQLRIPAGALTRKIALPIVNDGATEPDETVTVTLDSATNAGIGAHPAITFTIKASH